jgi:hypothetical protein
MARKSYLLFFVLALALAYSQSQTPSSGSSPSGQATPSNNAGSIYGNTTTANPQSPQGSAPAAQPLPGTTQSNPPASGTAAPIRSGSATDASGGGVAGAAGSGTAPAQVPETPTPSATPAISDSDLPSQIQNALVKEPTLSGESVRVSVAEDNIEINGNVGTGREKLTATRIVQSYAGNKKVVNHLTVGGHSGANPSSPGANRESPNPSTNPEPNKGRPPAGSTQPPR